MHPRFVLVSCVHTWCAVYYRQNLSRFLQWKQLWLPQRIFSGVVASLSLYQPCFNVFIHVEI